MRVPSTTTMSSAPSTATSRWTALRSSVGAIMSKRNFGTPLTAPTRRITRPLQPYRSVIVTSLPRRRSTCARPRRLSGVLAMSRMLNRRRSRYDRENIVAMWEGGDVCSPIIWRMWIPRLAWKQFCTWWSTSPFLVSALRLYSKRVEVPILSENVCAGTFLLFAISEHQPH